MRKFFMVMSFLSMIFGTLKAEEKSVIKINTSNAGKFNEFQRLFSNYGYTLEATQFDLKEIEADPLTVAAHKASQLDEGILVEDTSLDIEGSSVGINVRWLLDNLKDCVGRKAYWRVLLAYRNEKVVSIYQGVITGTIVEPQGTGGFGFDPVFLPDGATETLAQSKPDEFNARAKVVEAFINKELLTTMPMIENWDGPWQQDH